MIRVLDEKSEVQATVPLRMDYKSNSVSLCARAETGNLKLKPVTMRCSIVVAEPLQPVHCCKYIILVTMKGSIVVAEF